MFKLKTTVEFSFNINNRAFRCTVGLEKVFLMKECGCHP